MAARSGWTTPSTDSEAPPLTTLPSNGECQSSTLHALPHAEATGAGTVACWGSSAPALSLADKLPAVPHAAEPSGVWQSIACNTFTPEQVKWILLSAMPDFYEE